MVAMLAELALTDLVRTIPDLSAVGAVESSRVVYDPVIVTVSLLT